MHGSISFGREADAERLENIVRRKGQAIRAAESATRRQLFKAARKRNLRDEVMPGEFKARRIEMIRARVLSFSAVLAFAASMSVSAVGLAQETTTTTTTPKSRVVTAEIETAQVIYVSGDDAVLKLPDGNLRLLEVPAGTPLTVDGKAAKVSDLQVGSTISHLKVSSRTESQVATVTQINGIVTMKHCPNLTLRLDDGTSKNYRVPSNAKFMIDGQESTCPELRTGAKLSATVVKTEGISTVNKGATVAAQTPPQVGILLIQR